MADSILTQTDNFKPSPAIVGVCVNFLTSERDTMEALATALLGRMRDKEAPQDDSDRSTELVLMELLAEQIGDTRNVKAVERMLTGVDR